tara:strand:- start:335 stop:1318 length:984 start_codon:yes stop_codon:yes gene_type:complete
MAQLRIKRSTGSSAPSSSGLANAELAFSEGDETLYYGKGTSGSNAASVIKIGGKGAYVDLTNAQTVAGNKTFSNDITVTGNLTVNGTTTTVNTTNTTVSDPLMGLNNGAGSNANDCGLLIERGSTGDNAFIGWDESTDKFIVGTTTNTASDTGNLTISTGTLVAALEGNATTASTLQNARTIAGVSFNGSQNISLNNNAITNGAGYITSSGSTSGNAGTATQLATARNIAGVSFNGTANISLNNNAITNGAGYITSSSSISGNAATATTATTATNVTATANNSTNETVYLTFVDGATGGQGIETDTGLAYNPSTGLLTVGSIDGGTY